MPKIRFRSKGGRCPLCRVPFMERVGDYLCSGCEVRYHDDCARELGGCGTLGCERMGTGPTEETPVAQGRGARIRRHARAARERRASRGRLRERHFEELQEAGPRAGTPEGQDMSAWDLAGVLLAGLDLLSCLAIFGGLLISAAVWGTMR